MQLHNLKPHLHRTFKLSGCEIPREPEADVWWGWYLNPPDQALVLC